jgi:hypothetical protein
VSAAPVEPETADGITLRGVLVLAAIAEAGVAFAAYERTPDPKRLVVIDGDDFVPYAGEAQAESVDAAAAFFGQFL